MVLEPPVPELTVTDFAASLHFYTVVLGFGFISLTSLIAAMEKHN